MILINIISVANDALIITVTDIVWKENNGLCDERARDGNKQFICEERWKYLKKKNYYSYILDMRHIDC